MKIIKEFKEFAMKGNVMDMAIGIIIGAAFGKIVSSIVTDIIMPPIGLLLGRVDFSQLFISLDGNSYATLADLEKVGAPAIKLGVFLNDTISFVILGFVMFMFIKSYNKLKKEEVVTEKAPTTKVCSDCAMEIPVAAKKCGHCGNTAV